MTPTRVVLDTNVLCSALLFRAGSVAWLRVEWQGSAIRPLASRASVAELIRVLTYPKFALDEAGGADLLVTGDGDLLALKEAFEVPILTPGEARERLVAH